VLPRGAAAAGEGAAGGGEAGRLTALAAVSPQGVPVDAMAAAPGGGAATLALFVSLPGDESGRRGGAGRAGARARMAAKAAAAAGGPVPFRTAVVRAADLGADPAAALAAAVGGGGV